MPNLQYVKPEHIQLKNSTEFNESWVQSRIVEDPSILRLGNLTLIARERSQPRGRLDLYFRDQNDEQRYEVEIQLGSTDESHIIRTIEYWDIEKIRYPKPDHFPVIIAEDITSRFFNVISLFHKSIPLIAIQMNAVKLGNQISLVFTKVLDLTSLYAEDDEENAEVTDRSYWEKRSSKEMLDYCDKFLELIHTFDPSFELKYNKSYIGLAQQGQPNNFVAFKPKKSVIHFNIKMYQSEEIENKFQEKKLDVINYSRHGRYKIRLSKTDIEVNNEFLKELLKTSWEQQNE